MTSSFDLLLLCFMLFIVRVFFSLHIDMLFLSTYQNTQFSFPNLFTLMVANDVIFINGPTRDVRNDQRFEVSFC